MAKYDPTPFRQSIGVDDENHLVTIAQPGAGKSTTAIWPNLIAHPYPDSVFILDPKGEHAQHTSASRSKLGPVFILDPQNQTSGLPTVCFNPLDEIDITAGDAKERLNELGEAMYVSTGSKSEHPHFKDICIAMIAGLCAHIKSWPAYPTSMQNLPGVYDLIMKGGLEKPDPKEAAKAFEALLNEMAMNPAAGEAPMEAVRVLRTAGGSELGSIFTTLIRCIRWVSSKNMREHLQRSDFSLAELRTNVCSVYVVLDFADMAPEKQGRYMRVLMSMAMDRVRKTPLPPARKARRTLFILDEVGMLGKMPTIERNYKILRGAHVKLWSFFQEYETVTQTFDNAEALMAASTKQFFGVSDTTTAEKIEKHLGKFLDVRRSGSGSGEGKYEQTKALLSADEISDVLRQKSLSQIVITGGGAKFMLRRVPCYPKASEPLLLPAPKEKPALPSPKELTIAPVKVEKPLLKSPPKEKPPASPVPPTSKLKTTIRKS